MANLKDIGYGVGKYLVASDASSIPDIGNNRKNLDLLNFKVATNNAYALYNFKDGMIDAYQTEAGVDATTSTNETYDSTDKYYSPTIVAAATTAFTSTGAATYTCPTGVTSAEILIVAGGGGGGSNHQGGGGGAGGIVHDTDYALVGGTVYDLSVGAGGAVNTTGTNSVWNVNAEGSGITLTANGGGGGQGVAGGSGSGYYGGPLGPGGASNQPSFPGATSYGNAGGGSPASAGGGGGGGANAVGTTSNSANGAAGGAGKEFSSFDAYGTNSSNGSGATPGSGSGKGYFGGGGGGGSFPPPPNTGGTGGAGGGGQGAYYNPNAPSTAGFVNTGGGGGARSHDGNNGSAGGSGILLIKTAAATTNMTLLSNTQAAQAAPTEGRLMLYEQDVDAITLDTDIKGYVSRDGGTTYTQTPLTDDGYINTYRGIDSYTKLMLHCDGANAGTTFTDSSLIPKTVTRNQGTTVTAIKKFGTAAGYFDGSGTYPTGNLVVANDSDFDFTGDFTVDFWLYLPSNAASLKNQKILGCSLYSGGWQGWHIKKDNANLRLNFEGTGSLGGFNTQFSSDVAVETWTHVAVVRSGTTTSGYLNGTSAMSFSQSGTVQTSGHDFVVGMEHNDAWWDYPVMHIDEIRISKGIARWTSAFTAPDLPYNIADRILSGSVDISGQPAGSDMKYKVETLNNKNLKLHGASLLWA